MKLIENIKALKKISLAYAMQIFAVIVLFFFAGSSSANQAKETTTNIGLPSLINKNDFSNSYKDSSLTGKTNFLWKVHTGQSR